MGYTPKNYCKGPQTTTMRRNFNKLQAEKNEPSLSEALKFKSKKPKKDFVELMRDRRKSREDLHDV